jgi:hypothetical protein
MGPRGWLTLSRAVSESIALNCNATVVHLLRGDAAMTFLRDLQPQRGFAEPAVSTPSLRDYRVWIMQQVDSQELLATWDLLLTIDEDLSIRETEKQKIRTEVMTYVNKTIHSGNPHQIPWRARILQEGGPLISASLRHIIKRIICESTVGGSPSHYVGLGRYSI